MKKLILTASALILLLGLCVSAQVTTGTILGTVKDPSGAVVPGVTIVITESSKGLSKTFVTDDIGTYTVPFLVPGTYDVSAEITGFKKQVKTGVILQVDQKARVVDGRVGLCRRGSRQLSHEPPCAWASIRTGSGR